MAVAMALLLVLAPVAARAAIASGVYQTLPGSTVHEIGDRVPNQSRIVPICGTFRLDPDTVPPALTVTFTNAVLEGGEPFLLLVRSSSGVQLPDGTLRFTGDYLRELSPSPTQYLFDYRFSASTNGELLWSGNHYWAGGHIWQVTLSNVVLVPVPWLEIAHTEARSVQVAWATNFADYLLEAATSLSVPDWSTVTNSPVTTGERVVVTLEAEAAGRFYRLRRP